MPYAWVTGASRGIGQGIALALAGAGFDVAGVARDATRLDETRQGVEALGRRFLPLAGDVADLDAHAAWLDAATAEWNAPPDVLVNNAGVAPVERRDVLSMEPESFDRLMAINLRGPFFLTQRIARAMVEAGDGASRTIVFVTSVSASWPSPNRMEYCISKAGLSMGAAGYAARLAGDGIRVYEIRPGIIRTDMTAGVTAKYDALIDGGGLVPQGRWGTPEDIGRACASLARGDFGYSTGQVFEIGGGMGLRVL